MGKIKSRWIWLLAVALIFVVNIWPLVGPQSTSVSPSFFSFLERHYRAFKQNVISAVSGSVKNPDSNIIIYRIEVPFRSQLLLDKDLQEKVVAQLKDHKGLILSDIDPEAISQNSILNKLYSMPNFVKDFRFTSGFETRPEIQERIARLIGSQVKTEIPSSKRIRPNSEVYFSDTTSTYGTSIFFKDLRSHFTQEYPLSVRGEFLRLPTMATIYIQNKMKCPTFDGSSATSLKCGTLELSDPLPLHFYDRSFLILNQNKRIPNPNATLVLEVFDEASLLTTPNRVNASWGELLATTLSNLEQGHYLKRPWWIPWLELLLLICLSTVIVVGAQYARLKILIPIVLVSFGFFISMDLFLMMLWSIHGQPIPEFFSLAVVSLVALSTRAVRDFEDRSKLERAFSGYLSEQRLERVIKGEESLQLEGRRAELAILILDIVGFSKLSQKISAEEAFQLMRDFFSAVDPIIFKHGGFIDKKMGDGMIAVFGDDTKTHPEPRDFTAAAIDAALEIQKLNKKVNLRIGINSGNLMIGNSGSAQHFNYTVVGEVVNFTQRLEAACPAGSVLVGPNVEEVTRGLFDAKKQEIRIKGDDRTFEAYEILNRSL